MTASGRRPAADRPCLIIAEAGGNHNGSLDTDLERRTHPSGNLPE